MADYAHVHAPPNGSRAYCAACIYAEGYRAGRIAALREVGCARVYAYGYSCANVHIHKADECSRCRLLAEAESGEDTGEVGDDR